MKSIADQLPPEIARQLHPDRRKNEAFQRAIAAGLLAAYENADQVDPTWEQTIQSYLIGSMEEAEPLPTLYAAVALGCFSGARAPGSSGSIRFYVPAAKVKAAIRRAFDRMTAAAARPGADRIFDVTADALARVIKSFDEPAHR